MTDKPQTIYQAFLKVCAGVDNVKRSATGQVGQQKYKYATLDQVLDMVNPLLEQNALALVQYVDDDTLRALLVHESGEKLPLGGYNLGAIGKHQERGSAITYGRRYQLCAIFGITQEDDDGAAASKDVNEGPAVFKNAALRNTFCANVIKSWEACENLPELIERKELDKAKLEEMKVGSEHDQLAAEELKKRYILLYKKYDEADRLNRQADRGNFDGGDDE